MQAGKPESKVPEPSSSFFSERQKIHKLQLWLCWKAKFCKTKQKPIKLFQTWNFNVECFSQQLTSCITLWPCCDWAVTMMRRRSKRCEARILSNQSWSQASYTFLACRLLHWLHMQYSILRYAFRASTPLAWDHFALMQLFLYTLCFACCYLLIVITLVFWKMLAFRDVTLLKHDSGTVA